MTEYIIEFYDKNKYLVGNACFESDSPVVMRGFYPTTTMVARTAKIFTKAQILARQEQPSKLEQDLPVGEGVGDGENLDDGE